MQDSKGLVMASITIRFHNRRDNKDVIKKREAAYCDPKGCDMGYLLAAMIQRGHARCLDSYSMDWMVLKCVKDCVMQITRHTGFEIFERIV